MVDIHAHILPDIDDGAESLEDAILMLRRAADSGVTTIVATPHLLPGSYMVPSGGRDEKLIKVSEHAHELEIPIEVIPGRECYLSPELFEYEKDIRKLTVNNAGKYVLVELPFQSTPDYVYQALFDFLVRSITPIIAHAERYGDVMYDPSFVQKFIENGCLIQVNIGSILGRYGSEVQRTSRILLQHRMAHIIASDMHSPHSLPLGHNTEAIKELVGEEETWNLLDKRPRAVVEGKLVERPEPLEYHRKKTFWNFWGLLR